MHSKFWSSEDSASLKFQEAAKIISLLQSYMVKPVSPSFLSLVSDRERIEWIEHEKCLAKKIIDTLSGKPEFLYEREFHRMVKEIMMEARDKCREKGHNSSEFVDLLDLIDSEIVRLTIFAKTCF